MQQNQNEALFFLGYYEGKINYTLPKEGAYFSFNFGWSSNQIDIVR